LPWYFARDLQCAPIPKLLWRLFALHYHNISSSRQLPHFDYTVGQGEQSITNSKYIKSRLKLLLVTALAWNHTIEGEISEGWFENVNQC
jgi:hypothetical protein